MKRLIALTFLVASAIAMPAVPALANSSIDSYCGPSAPEGYKRPGGYCEQIDNNNSLVDTKQPDCIARPASFIQPSALDAILLMAGIDCAYEKRDLIQT